MAFYLKDPQARVDYQMDWGGGYLDGQNIAGSSWSVSPNEPGGVSINSHSFNLLTTAVRITGGIAGHVYSVTNRVTLSDGTIDERSITLRVEDR